MPSAEPSPRPDLSPRHREALEEFIRAWGEMASYWGINRTMAQIHALLYASERPLDTDEIMARLGISRGNANMNLRALVDWNLVTKSHQPGSRKDYYAAEKDVWTITTTIIEQRRRQEIMPVQQALARCAATLHEGGPLSPEEARFAARVDNLAGFLDVFEGFTSAFLPFLRSRSADKVKKVIQFARRLRSRREAADA
ncbi:MAG TPA: MarR family transcriptional regulator [Rubricoccaceae bacterium]|nr:MarR family transcriptional regulator [Rubricoccaceae bacterium]